MIVPSNVSFHKIAPMFTQKYERYLPTAFDESMSLLEKVNKIIEQINVTVEGFNNVAGYVEKMSENQYNLIKDLYDDWEVWREWLENEGLRSRTSEVLQEWFDSGKLADIINNDVFNMKANQSELDETNEQLAQITYNLKSFGVKGDGVTDDKNAIQFAIDFIKSKGGGNLLFPSGVYLVIGQLDLNGLENCTIYGHKEQTVVKTGTSMSQLDPDTFRGSNCKNIIIQDMVFDGALLTTRPLRFDNSNNITIERVNAINLSRQSNQGGVLRIALINDSDYVYLRDITTGFGVAGINGCKHVFSNNLVAITNNPDADELIDFNSCKYIYIDNCYGEGFIGEMLDMGAVSEVSITDCTSVNCTQGIILKGEENRTGFEPGIHNIKIDNFTIVDCTMGIRLNTTTNIQGQVLENIEIRNCDISVTTDLQTNKGAIMITHSTLSESPKNILIDNCKLKGVGIGNGVDVVSFGSDIAVRHTTVVGFINNIRLRGRDNGNLKVIHCTIEGSLQRGIYITSDQEDIYLNAVVDNNVVKNCGSVSYESIYISSTQVNTRNVRVRGNDVIDNRTETAVNGIRLLRLSYVYLTHNNIFSISTPIRKDQITNLVEKDNDGVSS